MHIRPTEDWYWYFDEKLDALMIDLSQDMIFRSRLTKKMIIIDALDGREFSVEDATLYYQFSESCEVLALCEPNKVELILNALAVRNYLKPLMPKSWYFEAQTCLFVPKIGDIAVATIQTSHEIVQLLVIDSSSTAALCIIAQPTAFIAGKTYYLGEAIKVMHNRLFPWDPFTVDRSVAEENDPLTQFLNKVC